MRSQWEVDLFSINSQLLDIDTILRKRFIGLVGKDNVSNKIAYRKHQLSRTILFGTYSLTPPHTSSLPYSLTHSLTYVIIQVNQLSNGTNHQYSSLGDWEWSKLNHMVGTIVLLN